MNSVPRDFAYRTANPTSALLMAGVVGVVTLLVPFTLLRLLVLSLAIGLFIWAVIQWLRRNRGVQITTDMLIVDRQPPRPGKRLPLAQIIGWASTADNCLIVAYLVPPKTPTMTAPDRAGLALADAHPTPSARPTRHLLITLPLKDNASCVAALSESMSSLGQSQVLPEKELRNLARMLRIRIIILFLLAVLSTPIYIILIAHLIAFL